MDNARKRAEVDRYSAISIPLDAYEAEYRNNLAANTAAIEALAEGDPRNLSAGVGMVSAEQTNRDEKARIAMANEMFGIEKMRADAKTEQDQQLMAIDTAEATMQDQIAYEEEQKRLMAINTAVSGLGQVVDSVADVAPLFGTSNNQKRAMELFESDEFMSQLIEGFDRTKLKPAQKTDILKKLAAADITGKNFRRGRRSGFAVPAEGGQDASRMFDFSIFDNVDFNYD
tara:strand:- start:854 stop:1540 length:687 start_codon:yes stop_codon:yes gene_type:complete